MTFVCESCHCFSRMLDHSIIFSAMNLFEIAPAPPGGSIYQHFHCKKHSRMASSIIKKPFGNKVPLWMQR